MNNIDTLYQYNKTLLSELSVSYQKWQHEPIVDFATDVKVAERLGWSGTHSKSLFLKVKGGGYALYLTDKDSRLDKAKVKLALAKRTSICSNDEMTEQIGCIPGAVCPIGLDKHITLLVEAHLFQCAEILYTPGKPDYTFAISGADLKRTLEALPNPLFVI
ncbi:YbaK/EbsC family protein [Vibrio hippocampi]|uniref:YbaK/aminoacyl-tRNA synthetase-associated domain-containing protein n=1 Tax=Vibrio hippocampi TaxID=654686 RepID=A0ABN8DF83_9VIBR|nr:YbaK/EbsC family protein [Vibrio hippocampi]CAH0524632.1 hypothetical protein VHP8226_00480 [Vibrio hippocampi]